MIAELRRAVPRLADAGRLRPLYPRYDDFRRVRAEVDPEGRFGNSYLTRSSGVLTSCDGSLTPCAGTEPRPAVRPLSGLVASARGCH